MRNYTRVKLLPQPGGLSPFLVQCKDSLGNLTIT